MFWSYWRKPAEKVDSTQFLGDVCVQRSKTYWYQTGKLRWINTSHGCLDVVMGRWVTGFPHIFVTDMLKDLISTGIHTQMQPFH